MPKDLDEEREDDRDDKLGDGDKKKWSELVKDLTSMGLATIFMTEDSVRNYLKDKKIPKDIPKDIAQAIFEGMGRKKDDLYGLIAKEFGRVLSKIDISQEVSKFLEKHDVQFQGKVSFEPKTGAKTAKADSESENNA